MKQIYIIIAGLLISNTLNAHRYVCNGILANGQQRDDSCGVCDDDHAARWANPNIPVVVDDTPLPAGISKADWAAVVHDSFKAWNDVVGSSLRFVQIQAENRRDFGKDESLHEIFWVNDSEEWRRLVGVGEFGTLGATLPRYSCGGALGSKRRIFDADLVLNGMAAINWKVNCEEDGDCMSVQTTLVHELGHFFGLDHPCLLCSTSIMSARAGFDLMVPVEDDKIGVRTLYPEVQNGGFGSPCTIKSDCLDGFDCINNKGNQYCSVECRDDKDCDLSAVCEQKADKKQCVLIGEVSGENRELGENCSRIKCEERLLCIGAEEEEYFCALPCSLDSDCLSGQNCVYLKDNSRACIFVKKNGEPCTRATLCHEDSVCITQGKESVCRKPCSAKNADQDCPGGEYCSYVSLGTSVCLPLNESLSLGEQASGFDASFPGTTDLGREGKKARTTGGCAMVNLNEDQNMPLIWLGLIVGAIGLKRRSIRSTH